MAISLIEHKRITTTVAKAKALRKYVEPLVTKAKDNTTHSRRVIFSYLQNKEAVQELFATIAPKIGERPGGYVRVIKIGFRRGDGGETAMIEFVDFNEVYNPNRGKERVKKKTRRGSSGAGAAKKATDAVVEETPAVVEAAADAPVEEAVVHHAAPEAHAEPEVAAAEETPAEPAAEETKEDEQA
jgi:large subunit ribosomal protein L17